MADESEGMGNTINPSGTFPVLETGRLLLREPVSADTGHFFELRSNPVHNQYIDRPLCETREEAGAFLANLKTNLAKGDCYYWVVELRPDAFAGTVCLFHVTSAKAEVGFELLAGYRGRGIMREAVSMVLNFARMKGLRFIEAYTHPGNEPSQRLLKSLQFRQTDPSGEVPGFIRFEFSLNP